MKWRRVPPVHSPIAPRTLLSAARAALGLGDERSEALAAQISTRFDARDTVLTDSGTSALVLALRAAAPPNGVVAMPGYCCIDIVAAAIRAGVRVSLYDTDPETLSPDLDSLRHALQSGACAVVVAPLYGYPPDMTAVAKLVADHGIPLIEDAAQGAGGTLDSKRLGAFGDLTVLSFGRGKGTTAGSGGALLLRGPRSAEWAEAARAHLDPARRGARHIVALAAQWMFARPALYSIPASIPALKLGEMVYRLAHEPRALGAAAAAVLPTALALDDDEVRSRRACAASLMAAAAPARHFSPIRAVANANPGYLRLAVLDGSGTAAAAPRLGALRGYPITLDEHPETARVLVNRQPAIGGARVLRDKLFTLPTHSRVSARDFARLAEWLGSSADSVRLPLRAHEAT